ncbi:hypothetical protein NCG97_16030 [Streptomyces lydicamycinicus]|nr:hypothetical protein [Streptomyces lydicamycinicus]USA01834.1 hypothetical protein NCG97_16030 [Streptomyces lydicamycinicus]
MTQSYRRSGDEMPQHRPYAYGDDEQSHGQTYGQGHGHETYGGPRGARVPRTPPSVSRRFRRRPRTHPSRGGGPADRSR